MRNVHKSLYNKLKAEIAMITGQENGNISDLRYWYQNIEFTSCDEEVLRCASCEASLIPARAGHLPKHKEDCPIEIHYRAIDRQNKN